MVSPHRRGGPIYQPVYYEQPHMGQAHSTAAYPAHVSHGHYMNAYYPPSAYYDAGAGPKYHGVPRSHLYPEYSHEGDYHRYGPYMHPY